MSPTEAAAQGFATALYWDKAEGNDELAVMFSLFSATAPAVEMTAGALHTKIREDHPQKYVESGMWLRSDLSFATVWNMSDPAEIVAIDKTGMKVGGRHYDWQIYSLLVAADMEGDRLCTPSNEY
jgi:hypothetical protein